MNVRKSSIELAEVRLGDITTKIGSGATPRGGKESYKTYGISLIRSMNVYDSAFDYSGLAYIDIDQAKSLDNVTVEENDVLINITGASVARCCMVPKNVLPARVNQHVAIIRPNKAHVNPFYVQYCLVSPHYKNHLLSISQGGATREALTKEKIEDFRIPLPHISTQHKIASILSAYDDLIENNTRRIKILEEVAHTIYNEWFVKFKFPGHENVKMVDSELGMIPEGWEVRELRDVSFISRGKSYGSNDLVDEGGLPFINLKCIDRDGGFRYDGVKQYNGKYKDGHMVRTGDIVMAVTDMTQERRLVARSARVPILSGDVAIISMDLIKITANEFIPSDYLYGVLRYSDFADNVKQYANGANVLHLNPEHVLTFKFVLAQNKWRYSYSKLCEYIYGEVNILYEKNINLRTTRDLLLPRLISGEVDVSELDINMEEITA